MLTQFACSIEQSLDFPISLHLPHILITLIIKVQNSGATDAQTSGPVQLIKPSGAIHKSFFPTLTSNYHTCFQSHIYFFYAVVLGVRNEQVFGLVSVYWGKLGYWLAGSQVVYGQGCGVLVGGYYAAWLNEGAVLIGNDQHLHIELRQHGFFIRLIVDNRTGLIKQHDLNPTNTIPSLSTLPSKNTLSIGSKIKLLNTMIGRIDKKNSLIITVHIYSKMVLEVSQCA